MTRWLPGDLVVASRDFYSADDAVYRVVGVAGSAVELADAVTGEWAVASAWELEPYDEIHVHVL